MADLDIREGRLKDVEVSGGFFLGPPEVLSDITGALEDAPAYLTEEDLATTHDFDLRRAKIESTLMEDRLSPEELAEAEELARTKYGTREWI
jgi:lipoate---protein ligase